MSRLLPILLILFSVTCYGDVATETWPTKLHDLPSSKPLVVQGFKITERDAAEQEGRGTGGGMSDVVVQNTRTGAKRSLHTQNAGIAVLAFITAGRSWRFGGGRVAVPGRGRFTASSTMITSMCAQTSLRSSTSTRRTRLVPRLCRAARTSSIMSRPACQNAARRDKALERTEASGRDFFVF